MKYSDYKAGLLVTGKSTRLSGVDVSTDFVGKLVGTYDEFAFRVERIRGDSRSDRFLILPREVYPITDSNELYDIY